MALGYLLPQLRAKLRFDWTAADPRRFDRWQRCFAALDGLTPRAVVRLGMLATIWDMRLRYLTGATVV